MRVHSLCIRWLEFEGVVALRMRKRIALAAIFALSGCATGALSNSTVNAISLASAARLVDAEAARHAHGSMTVAIVDHGRTAWIKSYGFADAERRVPATTDTVYRIGSITKQFTGYALLKLAAERRLKLDDPSVRYVPELPAAIGGATAGVDMLALATQRAGLAREPVDERYSTGGIDHWQEIARDALMHTQAPFAPYAEARYSNIGYAAVGLAIEAASGEPYIDYVERAIIRPLGMGSTTFRPDAKMLARLAKGYRGADDLDAAPANAELVAGRGYRIPNGGLFSTTTDLAKFMAFEMGEVPHPPLDANAMAENFARNYPMSGGGRYGVGFSVEEFGGRRLIGHNGLVTGYASSAFFDPDAKIGIVCLGSAEDMCQSRFLDVYAALSPAWIAIAAKARAARDAIDGRVSAQQPYPNGEAVLRRFVIGLAAGTPDYSALGTALGGAVKDHLRALQDQFVGLGKLESVRFQRVDAAGADVYKTQFAHGTVEWKLTLDDGTILETATMKALP